MKTTTAITKFKKMGFAVTDTTPEKKALHKYTATVAGVQVEGGTVSILVEFTDFFGKFECSAYAVTFPSSKGMTTWKRRGSDFDSATEVLETAMEDMNPSQYVTIS